jgi:hypothetical protein
MASMARGPRHPRERSALPIDDRVANDLEELRSLFSGPDERRPERSDEPEQPALETDPVDDAADEALPESGQDDAWPERDPDAEEDAEEDWERVEADVGEPRWARAAATALDRWSEREGEQASAVEGRRPADDPEPAAAEPSRRRSLWSLALITGLMVTVAFGAGIWSGWGTGRVPARPADVTVAPAHGGVSTGTVAPITAAPAPTAPPACLDTARYGDRVIDMLSDGIRDQRLYRALEAYTRASQRCRAAAVP